jgi:hypothetical protein
MASFNFTSVVLDEGTTFTFSSWFCIAETREPTASAPASYCNIGALVDDLSEKFQFPI